LQRAERSLTAVKSTGRPKAIAPAQYPELERQLIAHPDATLAEHVALWEAGDGVSMTSRPCIAPSGGSAGPTKKDAGS
jgi:hypothetical protein